MQFRVASELQKKYLSYIAVIFTFFIIAYLITIRRYPPDRLFILFLSGCLTLIILMKPKLGLYLTLFFSPLKALPGGSGIITIAKVLGLLTFLGWLTKKVILERYPFKKSGLEIPLILLFFVYIVSLIRSHSPELDVESMISFLNLSLLFILIFNIIEDEKDLVRLIAVYLISTLIPVIFGFYQIIFSEDPLRGPLQGYRIIGTLTKSNGYGGFLITPIIMGFSFILSKSLPQRKILRLLVIILEIGMIINLLYTFSRGAWVGIILGLTYIFLSPAVKGKFPKIFVLFSLIIISIVIYMTPVFQNRLSHENLIESKSNIKRIDELKAAPSLFLRNPILGTGFGNYGERVRELWFNTQYEPPEDSHNIIVSIIVQSGIIGTLIWVLIFKKILSITRLRNVYNSHQPKSLVIFITSVASLVGTIPFMISHSGLYQNETWITLGILFASKRILIEQMERETSHSSYQ